MKTALEKVIQKLKDLRDLHPVSGSLNERVARGKYVFAIQVAEKELETEKQQIIDAVKYGFLDATKPSSNADISFDEYYNKTFKQE